MIGPLVGASGLSRVGASKLTPVGANGLSPVSASALSRVGETTGEEDLLTKIGV